jgi:hypothetical protein
LAKAGSATRPASSNEPPAPAMSSDRKN